MLLVRIHEVDLVYLLTSRSENLVAFGRDLAMLECNQVHLLFDLLNGKVGLGLLGGTAVEELQL